MKSYKEIHDEPSCLAFYADDFSTASAIASATSTKAVNEMIKRPMIPEEP